MAINKFYKYKDSKNRPNIYQILAELVDIEQQDNIEEEKIIDDKKKYLFLVNKYFNKYLKSQNRIEVLNSLKIPVEEPTLYRNRDKEITLCSATTNCIDLFMLEYIKIQSSIKCNNIIHTGLSSQFSKIKVNDEDCLLLYFRKKDFVDKIKNSQEILIDIPSYIVNYCLESIVKVLKKK